MKNLIKKIFRKKVYVNLSKREQWHQLKGHSKREMMDLCIRQQEEIEMLKDAKKFKDAVNKAALMLIARQEEKKS